MSPREIRFRSRQQKPLVKGFSFSPDPWICPNCGGGEYSSSLEKTEVIYSGGKFWWLKSCSDHKPSKEWKVMTILKRFKARREWLNTRKST